MEVVAEVFQLTSEWDENAATWVKATSSKNWKNKAGDYIAESISTHKFNPSKTMKQWHNIDVTAAAQAFYKNPDNNFGVIIVLGPQAEAVFNSSEASDSKLRPKLTIEYEPETSLSNPISINNNGMMVQKVTNGFNITLKDYKNSLVNLYGINGMKVKALSPSQKSVFISSQNLPKGIYLLRVKNRLTGMVNSVKISH